MLEDLLGAELFAQVQEKLGDKKLGVVNDGSWLPKSKLDEKLDELKLYKGLVGERDEQLANLKPMAETNQTLTQRIEQLQADNEKTKLDFDAKLKDTQLSSAIKLALTGKVQDLDIVSGLLDKSAIELDDNGGIKGGLDEQVTALKESKGFLFVPDKVEEEKPVITMSAGNPTPSSTKETSPFAAIMSKYK